MDKKDLKSIVNLLDDPDERIYLELVKTLLQAGTEVVPLLEDVWGNSQNPKVQQRIELIVDQIQQGQAHKGLKSWLAGGNYNLIEGAFWVAKNHYPNINLLDLKREMEQLYWTAWISIANTESRADQLRVVNYVLYDNFGLRVDTDNFFNPEHCFINRAFETKVAAPIILGIIYLHIAQRLGLPVYGVCPPKSFLLCFKRDEGGEDPSFYINPANRGSVLGRSDIVNYLNRIDEVPEDRYLQPCSPQDIIFRLIETIAFCYEQEDKEEKANLYKRLMDLFDQKE